MRLTFKKRSGPTDSLEIRLASGATVALEGPKQAITVPLELVHSVAVDVFRLRGYLHRVEEGEPPARALASPGLEDLQLEALVEALQSDAWGAVGSNEELDALLRLTCAARGVPPPGYSLTQLGEARQRLCALVERWRRLGEGEALELEI